MTDHSDGDGDGGPDPTDLLDTMKPGGGASAGAGNGLGFDMNPTSAARMMRDPSNIADLLLQRHPQTGECPAEIFADVVNVARADVRRLGLVHGVDVDAPQMEPERAAELLAGVVGGDGIEIVEMFNDLAIKRDRVLGAALDDEEHQRFRQQKHAVMHTEPGNPDDGDEA